MDKYPSLKPIPGSKRRYRLTNDITFVINGKRFLIKKGFETDGASIPRWLWIIIDHPFAPKIVRAAVIHDYLYGLKYNRKDADRLFRQTLREDKVAEYKVRLMYAGVRLGGWTRY